MEKKLVQKLAVVALIRDGEGRVLLQKRAMSGKLPAAYGKWEFPGGEVDFGEDPLAAVRREALEETGCVVAVSGLVPTVASQIWERVDGVSMHSLVLCYECRYLSGTPRVEGTKTTEIRWCTLGDIAGMECLDAVGLFLKAAPGLTS